MKIDVIIPTFDRPDLLLTTLKSIRKSEFREDCPVNLKSIVILDGNPDPYKSKLKQISSLSTVGKNEKSQDWIISINYAAKRSTADCLIYAADDVRFEKGCIQAALDLILLKFPDLDGMVSIKQDVTGCRTAFGMVGRKFMDRFPERQIMCPDYIHYGADREIGVYATKIGRLRHCDSARLTHSRLKDSTYIKAKRTEQIDLTIIKLREKLKVLWGEDFILLKE